MTKLTNEQKAEVENYLQSMLAHLADFQISLDNFADIQDQLNDLQSAQEFLDAITDLLEERNIP